MTNNTDRQFKELCNDIINNGYDVQSTRAKWKDGTDANTRKITNVVHRYDLSKEFPILTLRKVPLKSAIDELLWIWQKKSNNVNDLNSHIWDSWADEVTSQTLVEIHPLPEEDYSNMDTIIVNPITDKNLPLHSSKNYGDYYILEKNGNKRKIQFKNTGYITTVTQTSSSNGEVKDYYARSVNKVGYYGDYKAKDILNYFGDYFKRWVVTWQNMVRRTSGCYSGNINLYTDVKIHPDFQSCELFLRWVMNNNRYSQKALAFLQIDKDYYMSKCYSPNTCTLLTPKENTSLTLNKWFKINGEVFYSISDLAEYFRNQMKLTKTHNPSGQYNSYNIDKYIDALTTSGQLETFNPKEPLTNGSYIRFKLDIDRTIKRAYGYQLGIKHKYKEGYMDQVDKLLYDLKNNPNSRRMVINMFIPEDLWEMNLQPCAHSVTFNVTGNKLNAILNQRSQDVLVANGWNVSQYAILVHMLAQVSDLEVGELVHVISDAHIYDRHLPLVKELIKRESYSTPILKMNKEVKNFYDFTVNDFKLEDYTYGESLGKIEVAI